MELDENPYSVCMEVCVCVITLYDNRVGVCYVSHYIRGCAGIFSIISLQDGLEHQPPVETILSCLAGGKWSILPFPCD